MSVLVCELCKHPIELGREPWTHRLHPRTGRRILVCEDCMKGLDGQRDLNAAAERALAEDAEAPRHG